jgi:hypothetical protein
VDDIKSSMNRVTDAGGNVLDEPMTRPGIGECVSFVDTEGNRTVFCNLAVKKNHVS